MTDEIKNHKPEPRSWLLPALLVFLLIVTVILWFYTSRELVKIDRAVRAHQIHLIHHNQK